MQPRSKISYLRGSSIGFGGEEWNGEGIQVTCSGTQHSTSVKHVYIWFFYYSHRTYIFTGAFIFPNESTEPNCQLYKGRSFCVRNFTPIRGNTSNITQLSLGMAPGENTANFYAL